MKKIVFVDIDTQFDFMRSKGRLYVKGAERIIPNLKKLTVFAKKNKITVVSSVDAHSPRDSEFKIFPAHCIRGARGQKKIKETLLDKHIFIDSRKRTSRNLRNILDKYDQIILEKKSFDVFSNPNTKKILRNIDTVFVYGVATDYCVKAACIGLLRLGKKVNLVIDAIKPVSIKQGEKVLSQLKKKDIRFIKTNSLINFLF